MKVLIAEDDAVSALILSRSVERMGHETLVASDGLDAWRHIQEGQVQLVISDWMMPRMNGLELCRRIRESPGDSYIYVVLLTAKQQREDRLEGLEAGADDFLVKPVDRGELVARLNVAQRILSMQEQLRQHSLALEAMRNELERQNARLSELAVSDCLTGLKNRRFFHDTLDMSFSFSVRQGLPLSLVMLDVDQFKPYNDTFGHPAGDLLLRELATTLGQGVRQHDLVARYGGEEFVILLPGTKAESSRMICERLRSQVQAKSWPLRPVTASFGVTTIRPETLTALELVEEADKALYHSKQSGRNRVTHYHDLISVAL